MAIDVKVLRNDYSEKGIVKSEMNPDPIGQFSKWFEQALDSGIAEPNGMCLTTLGADGQPWVRTVLMKSVDSRGLMFFTNYSSRKAQQIEANSKVAVIFPWLSLHRQVIVQGVVEKASYEESAEYFLSRPRGSQIGAWASRQSETIDNRRVLEQRVGELEARFESNEIPVPEFWGGYLIVPTRFEFWQGRTSRLHDRLVYEKSASGHWEIVRLSP